MRKITMLVALVLISAFSFAQQKQKNTEFKAVKVLKSINNMTPGAKSVVDSLRYDGDNADGVGTNTTASTFGVYAFFPTSYTAAHNTNGNTITSVKVYVNGVTDVTSTTLKIFSDQGITSLVSQAFTPVEGWNEVTLTTPLAIPTTGLYIGYQLVTTGGYPAGCDGAITPNPNGNWIDFNGTWQHTTDLSVDLTANWNIRAMVSGTALTTPVAICNPLAWAAGVATVGTSVTSGTFTLQNVGAGTLTISGITGLSAPYTTTLVPATVNLTAGQTTDFTFTYAPTASGAADQTVVIATNAGNITVSLTGTGVECNVISTFPWSESFEGATFPPACWTKESPDGGTGWASIASGATPLPGWNGGTMSTPTGGGNNAAYATWNTGGASSNNQWLITPQFAIPTGKSLFFYVFRYGSYQDLLDVKASTTNNQSGSFGTTLLSLDSNSMPSAVWAIKEVNLSSLAGQNAYLAFNENIANNTDDGAFIALDLVSIDNVNSINESVKELVSIFPNPANDKLFIAANQIKSVEIYNLTGAKVVSFGNQNVINISDLAQGTYLVKVITDNKVTTQKINIVR